MSFQDIVDQILKENLCTSCGICVSVCSKKLLRMSNDNIPLPKWIESSYNIRNLCDNCNMCFKICPGFDTGTSASEKRIFGRLRTLEERWTGIYLKSYKLVTKNEKIRLRAAAGGACTTLAIVALKEKLVDAMLVIGREAERQWIPKAFITSSIDKVIECAQSSYCIVPALSQLGNTDYKRIGIIGLPCQIQGIQKLMNMRSNPRVANLASKIIFTLELGCSSSTPKSGTEHLITKVLGVKLEDVVKMQYRDGKYPGKFMVQTKDGFKHYLPFYRIVEEFTNFKTFRCLTCADWWSGVSDISVADGDPNIFDTSFKGYSVKPASTVIVRTEFGETLVEIAKDKKYIDVWEDAFINNLGLERKRHRYRSFLKQNLKIPLPPGADIYEENNLLSDDEVLRRGV
jgi:coenzyme F420 hydrogenase subunit beta